MAAVYSLAKARRREQAPPLPLPESLLAAADAFGFELPNTFTSFYLIRRREGTEVHIKGGRLSLNLSHALKTYPPGFKAARQWIKAIAERQNWQMVETESRW